MTTGSFRSATKGAPTARSSMASESMPHRPVDLADGDRIQLGTSVVLKLVRLDPTDERFQREMFERTVRDPLTGLYNRAYLLNQIGVLAERNAAQGIGLAVLMLDIDHFKRINDDMAMSPATGSCGKWPPSFANRPAPKTWLRGLGARSSSWPCRSRPGPGDRTRRADSQRTSPNGASSSGDAISVTASIGLAFRPPADRATRWP